MRATRESDVVTGCLEYLSYRGILAWRSNNTGIYDPVKQRFRSFRGLRGVSDILGVLPPEGRMLAVECKAPKGWLSQEQAVFLDRVLAAGGLALVIRDVADLARAMGEEGY